MRQQLRKEINGEKKPRKNKEVMKEKKEGNGQQKGNGQYKEKKKRKRGTIPCRLRNQEENKNEDFWPGNWSGNVWYIRIYCEVLTCW